MNKEEQINKLVEEALNSVDGITRAEGKPYLLTRINARMSKSTESAWEKTVRFITTPAVAFTGLCMIVLLNTAVVMLNKSSVKTSGSEVAVQSTTDEFSTTVVTIYDFENTQP